MTYTQICDQLDAEHAAGQIDAMLLTVRKLAIKRLRGDEDSAQNVVVKVLEGLPGYRGEAHPHHWVNRIIGRERKEREHNTDSYDDAIHGDAYRATYQFPDLSSITDTFISVVAEMVLKGYTIIEIAQMAGIEAKAVQKRVERYRVSRVKVSP